MRLATASWRIARCNFEFAFDVMRWIRTLSAFDAPPARTVRLARQPIPAGCTHMKVNIMKDQIWIDLSDIDLEDVEVLSQEGSRAIPEFAASTGTCDCGQCSCSSSCIDSDAKF